MMINRDVLREEYKQNLEESIIEYLAKIKQLEVREAMDIYYKSRLSEQIGDGKYGIENMDYKYLTLDLIENEPELFQEIIPEKIRRKRLL